MQTRGFAVALLFLIASSLSAQYVYVRSGDLILSSSEGSVFGFTFARFRVARLDGTDLSLTVNRFHIGGGDVLVGRDGLIYVVRFGGSTANSIDVFSPDLTLVRSFSTEPVENLRVIAMDAMERIYAFEHSGSRVARFSKEGTFLGAQDLFSPSAGGIDAADLGTDQCTLYYATRPQSTLPTRIRRYDLCRRIALPDFEEPVNYPFGAYAIRVANDGSVFYASGNRIHHFVRGRLERTYECPLNDCRSALPTADVQLLRVTGSQTIRLLNVATGEIVAGPLEGGGGGQALAIYGEPRAAAVAGIDAPALSRVAFAFLAILLAFSAFLRLRS